MPSALEGTYFDPRHGGCLRTITKNANGSWTIVGVYGTDEPHPGHSWSACAEVTYGHFVRVDFARKFVRHKRILHALWCPALGDVGELRWEDGNIWKKVPGRSVRLRRA